MRTTPGAFVLAVTTVLAACLGLLPPVTTARAACGDETGEPNALFSFDPPQSAGFLVTGTAPLTVTANWLLDTATVKGSTATISWGDGSAPTPLQAQDCGDDTINWAPQTHKHVYASPGQYPVTWNLSLPFIGNYAIAVANVIVGAAQAPTPTPAPTLAPTAAPTGTSPPAPTTAPPTAAVQPTEAPAAAATVTPATTASPTAAATASPTLSTPTATPTPTSPPTVVAAVTTETASPSPPSREPDLPPALREVPRIEEISTDGGTIATNIVLAGVTLWVLFSSVLLNQVLQDNRAEIDAKTGRMLAPLKRLRAATGVGAIGARRFIAPLVVLTGTGVIYSLLGSNLGLNRETALIFLSAVLGVGVVSWACSGIEAFMTRKSHGLSASVRPFPAAMLVAVASVGLSRAVNLQPGVVYGFVASCAISGPSAIDRRRQGSVTIFPVMAALTLSIVALLAAEPIRGSEGAASSFIGQLVVGVAMVVFIGGIEGVALNMLPLSVTDGGKLFAWRKPVWAAISLVAAFLAWHVLLNRDREAFDALRTASSVTVLAIFLAYSSLSVGLWAFFRWRDEPESLPEAPPHLPL